MVWVARDVSSCGQSWNTVEPGSTQRGAFACRLKVGDSFTKGVSNAQEVICIPIRLPRPEKALQPILHAPGDDVNVQMRDALTDPIVDRDERSFGPEPFLNSSCQQLSVSEKHADQALGKIIQCGVMFPGHQQTMPGK